MAFIGLLSDTSYHDVLQVLLGINRINQCFFLFFFGNYNKELNESEYVFLIINM